MRILAIRGCNLASLAGEFEIDLAHGALGAAGVFAIVGPTGAGKSTLLDAMCVALFDRTPRLANRSTVVVGRDDDPANLGAQDVRSLLRRGASAGYAEVDFESGDARRYRARWSVRRARNATDGRFQSQQVTLNALNSAGIGGLGESIGGTKTETLEAIHQRLGLSFDQFRRSALLAQGEFAAFLRADGKDRSELLERMTGTEIYSKLSIAAHQKAALAEQQLRERHGAALAIAMLSDDERALAESDLVLAKAAQTASRARFAAAEAAARWLVEAERHAGALVEAEATRTEVERAVEAAASERAELALRRRAETLRSPWEEAARLDRQLTLIRSEATIAAEAAAQSAAAQREIEAIRTQLLSLHAPIREARIAAGLIEVASSRQGQDLVARATAAAATDATWLLGRRDLGLAVAGWPFLDQQLAQHTALANEIAASDKILDDRAKRRAQLSAQRAAAVTAHQASLARLVEATAEATTYQSKRGLSLDGARRAEDEARRHCLELERLVAIAGEARGAAIARAELDLQLSELATATRNDATQRRSAEAERDRAATLRAERARMLDELRKAAGYTHARTELVEGDPCPLCGALEHPWHDRGAFDALIGDAQSRLAEVTQLGETALAMLATLTARDAQRTKEHARLVACHATAEATTSGAQRAWREHLASLGELLLVDDPSTPAAQQLASERVDAARSRLDGARMARSQAEAAAKAASEAQARVQTRQADVEHHVVALRDLDGQIASVDAAAERLRGERTGKADRLRDLLGAIDAAFARWHGALTPTDVARPILELTREALVSVLGAAPTHVGAGPVGAAPLGAAPLGAASLGAASLGAAPLGAASSHGGASLPGHNERAAADATSSTTPAPRKRGRARKTDDQSPVSTGPGHLEAERGEVAAEQGHVAAARGHAAVEPVIDRRGPSTLLDAHATSLLDRCRRALAELAATWTMHADVIAVLDAELAAAITAGESAAREAERVLAEQLARRDAAHDRRDIAVAELTAAAAKLDTARIAAGFDSEELRRLLTDEASRAETLAQQLESLDRAADRARTLVAERRRLVDDHAATSPFAYAISQSNLALEHAATDASRSDVPTDSTLRNHAATDAALRSDAPTDSTLRNHVATDATLRSDAARLPELEAAVSTADHHAAALAATLAADTDARARRAAALAQFADAERAAEVDRVLGEVIGSHDGKLFRSFAQSLTLDGLLAVANSHLEELAPRYQLERVPKHDLELQVIDRDLGNEIRSVQSLSGGESFLVSLALALGLSSMSAHDVRVRTLLIDEGFGTLDPATLDGALAVLDALQATGRQVGVISHVPALVERVGAHVRVSPRGGGRSEVLVAEA